MDHAEGYLYSRIVEASSSTSFVRSKMESLQLDEI